MNQGPFLPVAEPDLGPLEERYVLDAVRSGWVSSIGPYIDRFERDAAAFSGTKHAIAVSNGTVALHLALIARGIGAGDEVIVPDLTFAATAASVLHANATPVLVDVRPDSWCIDPSLVEHAITPKTKAIIAVHLFGHPADMIALRSIAKKHDVFLLEDAAEAHGAKVGGRVVGSIGDAACFSYYGNKLVTTGEGGSITSDDDAFIARARFLKDHAMSAQRRYFHTDVGYNYRMTNLQAALGCAQLERYAEMSKRKSDVLAWYREALADVEIVLNPKVGDVETVCWLVSGVLPERFADKRDDILRRMKAKHGVDSRPFFVPMSEMPPYAQCRKEGGATAARLSRCGLCLPSSNKLTRDDVERVARAVREEMHQ